MLSIESCPAPDNSLLNTYLREGTYVDCYKTDIHKSITHAQYVTAFYTTRLFKLERFILKQAAAKPSTDAQATQLACGTVDTFAAWHVEARSENQLLLCDFNKRTRSWLMVEHVTDDNNPLTRLYFGSAVVPVKDPSTGEHTLGGIYQALLGFHKLYSKVLLHSARVKLEKQQDSDINVI